MGNKMEEHFTVINFEFKENNFEPVVAWINTILINEVLKSKSIPNESCFLFLNALANPKRTAGIRTLTLVIKEQHEENKRHTIWAEQLALIINERFKGTKEYVLVSCLAGPSVKEIFNFSKLPGH